jgi:hypothetical protein
MILIKVALTAAILALLTTLFIKTVNSDALPDWFIYFIVITFIGSFATLIVCALLIIWF